MAIFLYKNNDISETHASNLVRFDVSLYTILGPPRQFPSHAICGPTQVRFLAS